jgi:hypothetical protein
MTAEPSRSQNRMNGSSEEHPRGELPSVDPNKSWFPTGTTSRPKSKPERIEATSALFLCGKHRYTSANASSKLLPWWPDLLLFQFPRGLSRGLLGLVPRSEFVA